MPLPVMFWMVVLSPGDLSTHIHFSIQRSVTKWQRLDRIVMEDKDPTHEIRKNGTILHVLNVSNEQISFALQVQSKAQDIHSANTERDILKSLLNSDGDALCYLMNYEWKYTLVNA
eukprot:871375_1